ncbi:MAG: hypothetical protein DRH03_05165 [Deltaproteobacteria bacterium]|nr:MAG: hypothetical protein DRH03_05165 [Deltaproteobacteria bacterium]
MKRWLKFLLWGGGLVAVLMIAAGIALKFYFNEARLRSLLLPPVRAALGREVDISSISIDLFRGIKIGGFTVKETDGKADFIKVKELGLSYSLLPLLEKRLEIGRVWLENPTVNVWRNRDGSFNFSDLKMLRPEPGNITGDNQTKVAIPDNPAAKALPLALVVQRCDITGASVTFVDKLKELPNVNLTADLNTKLDLGNLKPESIKVVGKLEFKLQTEYKSLTPGAVGTIEFDRRKIVYKVDIKQKNEACTLSGSLSDYLAAIPKLVLNIDSQRLDLAYLAGLGQQLSATGPAAEKPVSAKAGKPGSAVRAASPSSPQLKARGKIDIKQALYENYRVDNFFLHYDFDGVNLVISELAGKLADGLFAGAAVIKSLLKQPEFKGNFSLSELNLASLMTMAKPELKDSLSGTGAGEFVFSGRSGPGNTLQQSLSLDGKFSLRQAGMRKLPLTVALSQILSMPELADLQVDEFAGNLRIKKGQLKLNSSWHGDQLSGSAIGDIGLDGGLKVPADLILSQNLSAKLAQRYAWVRETFNDKGEAEVSIYLNGTLSQPQLRLNNTKVTQRLQKRLEDKLLQKLGERLSDGESESAGETSTDKPEDILRNFLQKK